MMIEQATFRETSAPAYPHDPMLAIHRQLK